MTIAQTDSFQNIKNPEYNSINVTKRHKSDRSGIINTESLSVNNKGYVSKLYVTDKLMVPVVNADYAVKDRSLNEQHGLRNLYRNLGALYYDATAKDLLVTDDSGETRSISTPQFPIKLKETILLTAINKSDGSYTSLIDSTNIGIPMNEHVYYTGNGYIVGINQDNIDNSNNFNPVGYMSRIDYFLSVFDSKTNAFGLDPQPVNHISYILQNNINGEVIIEIVNSGERTYIDFKVKADKEVKWFAILNIQKILIKKASDKDNNDIVHYNNPGKNLDWEPVFVQGNIRDCIMKFKEGINHVHISPFSNKMTKEETQNGQVILNTLENSLINNETEIVIKNTTDFSADTGGNYEKRREILTSTNTVLDDESSLRDYNTNMYYSTLLLQLSNSITKNLTSTYGFSYFDLKDSTNTILNTEHQIENNFTKDATKDAFNFVTNYIDTDESNWYGTKPGVYENGKSIKFVYQLEEKEYDYKPLVAVTHHKYFAAKKYNDRTESIAHREGRFFQQNTVDLDQRYRQKIVLYKNIGNFTADIDKYIYISDDGVYDTDDFVLGTHSFVKSHISIRDITNQKTINFVHSCSAIIPSYNLIREEITRLRKIDKDNETKVENITIVNKGSGYTQTPAVIITGDGSGATATANLGTDESGIVKTITLTDGGQNYTSAPSVVISGGNGTGASATANLGLNKLGKVVKINIVGGGGYGYTHPPKVYIKQNQNDSNGYGAKAVATIGSRNVENIGLTNVVTEIIVTDEGSGYSTDPNELPTVVISGGGVSAIEGSTNIAQASVVLGSDETDKVVSITLDNGGNGYTSTPSLSITGGDGSGAIATCTLGENNTDKVVSIDVVNSGSGYYDNNTQSTLVTIDAPTNGGTTATGQVTLTSTSSNRTHLENELKNIFINDNTLYNYVDKQDISETANQGYYLHSKQLEYNRNNGLNCISENHDSIEIQDFDLEIVTRPVLNYDVNTNVIDGTLEDIYNSVNVVFPIEVKCTSKVSSKYQVYVLLEINEFKIFS